jgi:phage gpG-like protein
MTLSQEKVAQKFNLEDIFGVDFSDRPDLKAQIGQAIIDKIIERTSKGEGRGGSPLWTYSTSYKESKKFEQYGKSSTVNMELTGSMLDSIDIIKDNGNEIEIGFGGPDKELQNAKAYGHETGMKGHRFLAGKVPKRPFFGLTGDEVKEIKSQFKDEVSQIEDKMTEESAIDLASIYQLQRGAAVPQTIKVSDFTLLEDLFDED